MAVAGCEHEHARRRKKTWIDRSVDLASETEQSDIAACLGLESLVGAVLQAVLGRYEHGDQEVIAGADVLFSFKDCLCVSLFA